MQMAQGGDLLLRHRNLERATALFLAGGSVRAVAAACGMAKATAAKVRQALGDRLPRCECGLENGHKGWCVPRYLKSELRQAYHAGRSSGRPSSTVSVTYDPLRCNNFVFQFSSTRPECLPRCSTKGCPYPEFGYGLCRWHAIFFEYESYLYGDGINREFYMEDKEEGTGQITMQAGRLDEIHAKEEELTIREVQRIVKRQRTSWPQQFRRDSYSRGEMRA